DLFKSETIERLKKHLINIIKEVLSNPEIKISDIEMLSEIEKEELIYGFNNTQKEYPKEKTISQLFEEQVVRTPDEIALVIDDKKLSYQKLNSKANQLAWKLRERGIKPDEIVAIMVDKSFEMVIGMLGVLKAGGTYLPIDPDYPLARKEYMLNDSNSKLLLTQSEFLNQLNYDEVLDLNDSNSYANKYANLEKINNSNNLAYVIYTSGTTGQPKGVMIEQIGVINLITWFSSQFDLNKYSRILQLTNFIFDPSVEQIFGGLSFGAAIYLVNKKVIGNIELLRRYVQENEIQMVNFVPGMLKEFLVHYEKISSLEIVISGGEKLNNQLKDQIIEKGYKLYNHYGPTETTVEALVTKCESDEDVKLGIPINNTRCYVLDEYLKPVPIGVVGELYISGVGVARGYLNRPDLTTERFIENPFVKGEKVYKTGDLVKRLTDGKIEFIGRKDYQVKIRGYRVELEEIEKVIVAHEGIKSGAVIDREDNDGDRYLVAYIELETGTEIEELRSYLKEKLPSYIIPSYFVVVDQMPLTINGKLDRKALLDQTEEGLEKVRGVYVAPADEVEEKLVEIWEEILGVEKIGVLDSFFELGGHSLRATTMVARIYKELNVELSLRDVFKNPTIRELAFVIKEKDQSIYTTIEPVERRDYYPVSSAQKRLFVLDQMKDGDTSYNMLGAVIIKGELGKERLEKTFDKLIERHEAFRTSFEFIDGKPVQRVHESLEFKVEYIELDRESKLVEQYVKEFIKPFDLSKAPLFRVGLIKIEEGKHLLIYDMHHIISDGVSMSILVNEFFRLYNEEELIPLRIQYKDFANWQNELFASEKRQKLEEYWLDQFAGEIPKLNLPTDYPRPNIMSFNGDQTTFSLDKELTEKLNELILKEGATLYMALLATFSVLLSKYSAQDDIIIGSPIAGRSHADLENIIGMFINTLAMRNYPSGEQTFVEFLEAVKVNSLNAYENQDYQFEMLVDKLDLDRDMSRNPLFDVMFTLQNIESSMNEIQGLEIAPYDLKGNIAKFDLSLIVTETPEGMNCAFAYSTDLFKSETIERLKKHLINIIKEVLSNPDIKISDIEMLSEIEKEELIYGFNNTQQEYPKEKTISQLFEEQVVRRPDEIALVIEDKKLSYHKLNTKANQLAWKLREKGIKPDEIVAIIVDKSFEMVIGMLGVLKAGGAYLPIDPDYPLARKEYMLNDSDSKLLLTQSEFLNQFNYDEILDLNDSNSYANKYDNLEKINNSNNLAYVIYTSGTTGQPKGVMIEHRGIANLQRFFAIREEDRIVQFASCAFDASVWEIFMALLSGARLYLITKDIINNYEKFVEFLNINRITIALLPPIYLNNLNPMKVRSFRKIITGGSATNFDLVQRWSQKIEYINAYGPTEATICATIWKPLGEDDYRTVPIGKPIINTKIYILNKNNQLTPIGVAGELCISGELARGYLNRPELTSEKFVTNPYTGERMYRTGDLVRWLPDGNIEFIGRIDHQVKIRGFRIELGEIENQLLNYPEIKEVVVIERGTKDDNYLAAYFLSDEELIAADLKKYLAAKLPEYMIPAHFVHLEKMPLTISGKIDRKKLTLTDLLIKSANKYIGPSNEIEEKITKIWEEILGVEKIGVLDSFFELGGHSLKATTMVARIYKELNVELSLRDVFKNPTIRELAFVIKEK
ncbi:MAG: amino acid adenylation domain-containing protein, partial [Halanaerobiales bacterium]|nr:amino acid adenylation domain-containing protein [Halanaerobiales bacterium]